MGPRTSGRISNWGGGCDISFNELETSPLPEFVRTATIPRVLQQARMVDDPTKERMDTLPRDTLRIAILFPGMVSLKLWIRFFDKNIGN